jgi:hypothetical protein
MREGPSQGVCGRFPLTPHSKHTHTRTHTRLHAQPDVVAPSFDIISARSSGQGVNPAIAMQRYGTYACAATSTLAPPAAAYGPFLPANTPVTAVEWVWSFPSPTTEAVRLDSITIPMASTAGGAFGVIVQSSSETQPTGFLPTPVFGSTPPLPGMGPYQAFVTTTVPPAAGAIDVVLPVGYELGVGWTGRIIITPSTGQGGSGGNRPSPILTPIPAEGSLPACFAPTTAPAATGLSFPAVQMSLQLSRGRGLGYVAAMSGSSSAAALVAGEAALVRQFFTDGFYPAGAPTPAAGFAPSAALLKAVLINSASPIAQQRFDASFGTATPPAAVLGLGGQGVPNLVRGLSFAQLGPASRALGQLPTLLLPGLAIAPGAPAQGRDPVLQAQGQRLLYCVDVAPPAPGMSIPLSITLVWTDPPSSPLVPAQALVNNLDLLIQPPGGALPVFGNNLTAQTDTRNNVEVVRFAAPMPTLTASGQRASPGYQVIVNASSLFLPPQAFSLVVTGPGVVLGALNVSTGLCDSAAAPPAPSPPAPAPPPAAASAPAGLTPTQATALTGGVLGTAFLVALGAAIYFYCRGAAPPRAAAAPGGAPKAAWGPASSAAAAQAPQAIELPTRGGAEWGAARPAASPKLAAGAAAGSVSTPNALRAALVPQATATEPPSLQLPTASASASI